MAWRQNSQQVSSTLHMLDLSVVTLHTVISKRDKAWQEVASGRKEVLLDCTRTSIGTVE